MSAGSKSSTTVCRVSNRSTASMARSRPSRIVTEFCRMCAPKLLPIDTNNSPAAVHQVLELPASGENASSSIGQQRYYNKADLLILVSNSSLTVKCGPASGSSTVIPTNNYSSWLATNISFYNTRE